MEIVQLFGGKTGYEAAIRELVAFALRELVRHEQQKKLLTLKGKITWEGDLNAMRSDIPEDEQA